MTVAPKEETYPGVVDHEYVRLALFLSELNDLEVMAADIGNAYLHAKIREKVYIVAGPEFDPELEGRVVMLIVKSLYGLTTPAARWHEELSQTLRAMGFEPTKADSDLWIKDCGTHYEYTCTWVDDVIVSSKNPSALSDEFIIRAKYILKGIGAPRYYLGGDYGRVNSTLLSNKSKSTCYLSAKTYIGNVCSKIESTMNVKLKNYQMPMDPNYHPEVDDTPLLSSELASKYRMLVGSGLWATTIGRFDVLYAVNTFARYNVMPREGHLEGMLRVLDISKASKKLNLSLISVTFLNMLKTKSHMDGGNYIPMLLRNCILKCPSKR